MASSFRLSRDDPRVGYPLSVREWSIVSVFNRVHINTVETKNYVKCTGAVERETQERTVSRTKSPEYTCLAGC